MSVVTSGVSSNIFDLVDEIPGVGEEVLERVYEIAGKMVNNPDFRNLATLRYWDLRGLPPPVVRMANNIIPLGYGMDFCQEPFQRQTLFYLDVGNDRKFLVNPLSGDFIHGVNLKDLDDFSYVGGRRYKPFSA